MSGTGPNVNKIRGKKQEEKSRRRRADSQSSIFVGDHSNLCFVGGGGDDHHYQQSDIRRQNRQNDNSRSRIFTVSTDYTEGRDGGGMEGENSDKGLQAGPRGKRVLSYRITEEKKEEELLNVS